MELEIVGTVTSPPLGAGIPKLRYLACLNHTVNGTGLSAFCSNTTENANAFGLEPSPGQESLQLIQRVVSIVVPLLFGLIVLVGLFGNALKFERMIIARTERITTSSVIVITNVQQKIRMQQWFCINDDDNDDDDDEERERHEH
ncbi:hypothetical protein C0J52_13485 [Blattella germanica]|nr:hypothetical protein C0J52_13485 [Blattella germanica]